jgi:hypothetical protein
MAVAHWPRHPPPSAKLASLPQLEDAALAPLLERVGENVALAPTLACSRIGSMPVSPSLRRQAHGGGRLGHSRGDKATAMHLLSLSGKPSAARSGPAVSTLIPKVRACVVAVRPASRVRRR